jgi:hypothetical protein
LNRNPPSQSRKFYPGYRSRPTWAVTVEVFKPRRNADRPDLDATKSCSAKKVGQGARLTQRESATFVERKGGGIERDRGVPEMAHHLHVAGVVPNIGSDGPVGTRHPRHLAHGSPRVAHEIEDKTGDRGIEFGVSKGKRLGVGKLEGYAFVCVRLSC